MAKAIMDRTAAAAPGGALRSGGHPGAAQPPLDLSLGHIGTRALQTAVPPDAKCLRWIPVITAARWCFWLKWAPRPIRHAPMALCVWAARIQLRGGAR